MTRLYYPDKWNSFKPFLKDKSSDLFKNISNTYGDICTSKNIH